MSSSSSPPLPSYKLYTAVHAFLQDGSTASSLETFQQQMNLLSASLLFPFARPPPCAEDVTMIHSGKGDINGNAITITDEMKSEILKMSVELHLNEKTCFEYWHYASEDNNRKWLAQYHQLDVNISLSISEAARLCVRTETLLLLDTLQLCWNNAIHSEASAKQQMVLRHCLALVQKGLILNLITALKTSISQERDVEVARKWTSLVVDLLYHIGYAVQLQVDEVLEIVTLLCSASNELQSYIQTLQTTSSTAVSLHALSTHLPTSESLKVSSLFQYTLTLFLIFSFAVEQVKNNKKGLKIRKKINLKKNCRMYPCWIVIQ